MNKTQNYRLEGIITLLSPLSHIGEIAGPEAYLSESEIIGLDGRPAKCFSYSGNAFRGQLRDLGAKYLLERLGNPRLPLDMFYLLFSGGSIGGKHVVDVDQARRYRETLPLLSLFGGGVGNQIMSGKMKVGAMWPLVREAQRVLPERYRDANAPSWGQWTEERSFTRTDDAKSELLREHLAEVQSEQPSQQDDRPQQMRYTVEVLSAGARLYQRIDLVDVTQLELGAFVSCLREFNRQPYIGGMSRLGFGLVEADWAEGTGEGREASVTLREGWVTLEPPKITALTNYDAYIYKNADAIREVLGIAAA